MLPTVLLEQSTLLYAALGLGVLLVVEGLYFLVVDARSGARAQINRRLTLLARGATPEDVLRTLRRRRRDETSLIGRLMPFLPWLDALIAHAGLTVSVTRVVLWIFGLTLVIAFALEALTPIGLPLALIAGLAVGVAVPVSFLLQRKRKRVRLFEEQLPGALDLLVRSLRVGHPLTAACAVVAQEMPDPLGTEFGLVVDEVTYGLDLPEAIDNMNERIDLPDLRYLTVAISIQHASGGNLSEVLSGLSKVIRERFQLFRKARAITAEGRISAWFLSIFPFFIILGVQFMRPGYYTDVADFPYFRHLVAITVVLLVLNILYMRSIVRLKV